MWGMLAWSGDEMGTRIGPRQTGNKRRLSSLLVNTAGPGPNTASEKFYDREYGADGEA